MHRARAPGYPRFRTVVSQRHAIGLSLALRPIYWGICYEISGTPCDGNRRTYVGILAKPKLRLLDQFVFQHQAPAAGAGRSDGNWYDQTCAWSDINGKGKSLIRIPGAVCA